MRDKKYIYVHRSLYFTFIFKIYPFFFLVISVTFIIFAELLRTYCMI